MEELEFTTQRLHSKKDFYIYNTMSGHKDLFKTMAPGKVGMYFTDVDDKVGHKFVVIVYICGPLSPANCVELVCLTF